MDLRMTPYSCLATGNQVGIIEFVHNAKTVYNIQRQGNRLAAMQFDSTQLYKWIREVSQKVRLWLMKRGKNICLKQFPKNIPTNFVAPIHKKIKN